MRVVIWGGTATGSFVYNKLNDKKSVVYFVDGNPDLIGQKKEGLEIRAVDSIFKDNIDYVAMGLLTGFEESIQYLTDHGFPEERIITKYVDLNIRARRDALEKTAMILDMKKIQGEVAELGVYRGDFAKEINRVFPNRKLYLFDTFEGFPECDMEYEIENDLLMRKPGKLANTSVQIVKDKLPYPDQVVFKKGYFPDTAEGIQEKFAFVNIDVDLYKPILSGLYWFWEHLVPGGYIFVHDYFSDSYAGTRKAIEEFAADNKIGFTPIGDMHSVAFVKGVKR